METSVPWAATVVVDGSSGWVVRGIGVVTETTGRVGTSVVPVVGEGAVGSCPLPASLMVMAAAVVWVVVVVG